MSKTIQVISQGGVDIFPATVVDGVGFEPARCSLSKLLDTYNVSTLWPLGEGYYTIGTAITVLEDNLESSQKIPGTKVGFLNSNGSYEEWEYFGGNYAFTNTSGWKRVDSMVLQDLLDTVYPLETTISTSIDLVGVGESLQGRLSWSVSRGGADVSEAAVKKLNGAVVDETDGKNLTLFSNTNKTDTYTFSATYQGVESTSTVEIAYVHESYVGLINANIEEPTESQVTGLNSYTIKDTNFSRTFPNLNYQKVCAAFPAYLGDVESIKDANGFEYIDSYTKTTLDIGGITYNVYVLTNATTITNFTQVWL